MEKVIFLYGFKGHKGHANAAKKIFGKQNVLVFEYDSDLKQTMEEIALELKQFIISKTSKNEKVNLIGVSAGGIISFYCAKFLLPKKINKVATVCSPFTGTYAAYFYSKKLKGIRQFEYNSSFIKKLKNVRLAKGKLISFWSYFDLGVPGKSAKKENPHYTWNIFHFIIQKDKKILKKIKTFFEKL